MTTSRTHTDSSLLGNKTTWGQPECDTISNKALCAGYDAFNHSFSLSLC
jgi:hypothetical protein